MVNLKVTRWGKKHTKTSSALHIVQCIYKKLNFSSLFSQCFFVIHLKLQAPCFYFLLFKQMCLFMAHFSHQGTLAVVNLSVISMKYFLSCKHIQMLTFPWSTFIGCYHIKTLTATYLMCVLDIAACFVDSEEMFGVSCTSNVWYYMHFKKTVLIGGPNKMSNIHLFLRNLQSQNRKTW